MTPEIERERRANQFVRNADLYGSDQAFKKMVDNTVYLGANEKEHSQDIVDSTYGTRHSSFCQIAWSKLDGSGDGS